MEDNYNNASPNTLSSRTTFIEIPGKAFVFWIMGKIPYDVLDCVFKHSPCTLRSVSENASFI